MKSFRVGVGVASLKAKICAIGKILNKDLFGTIRRMWRIRKLCWYLVEIKKAHYLEMEKDFSILCNRKHKDLL